MKRIKLTRSEQAIENAIGRGEFRPVPPQEFALIAEAIRRHRKDAVLNIRINSRVLAAIKTKAKKLKVPYQTLAAELLDRSTSESERIRKAWKEAREGKTVSLEALRKRLEGGQGRARP
jgi:hypothetical protein